MIDLLLQIFRVVIAYPLSKNRTDEAAGAASDRRGANRRCQRATGRDNGSNRRHCPDIYKSANQPALGFAAATARRAHVTLVVE